MNPVPATWRKSSFSNNVQACVELAVGPGVAHIRDSKNPAGGHLTFTRAEVAAFVAGLKAGEFDPLVS